VSLRRGYTLDAGALISLSRGDARVRGILEDAYENERTITIPAPALAQVWRGPPPWLLGGLLSFADVEPFDDQLSRRTGELLARTATSDVVDAAVAVSAAQRSDVVVTSDPEDMQRLADDLRTIRVLHI
jgi:predicted nucleic acid-binding protein